MLKSSILITSQSDTSHHNFMYLFTITFIDMNSFTHWINIITLRLTLYNNFSFHKIELLTLNKFLA